jgi:hypothetical protein
MEFKIYLVYTDDGLHAMKNRGMFHSILGRLKGHFCSKGLDWWKSKYIVVEIR